MSKVNKIEARECFDRDWDMGLYDRRVKEDCWYEFRVFYLKENKVKKKISKKKHK